MLLIAVASSLVIGVGARPSMIDRQVYEKCHAQLKKVSRLAYEVHEYESRKYRGKYADVWIDLSKGYRMEDGKKWLEISDLKRVWSKFGTGQVEIRKADGWEISKVLGFDVLPVRATPDFRDEKAKAVMFDKRSCYLLNPKYGESILTSYELYIDAKTFLPAGYSEYQMGESAVTVAYRKVRLNPKLAASLFVIPRS